MKRKLSPWCKEVKKTLIDRDMTVTDLCDQVGMCRNYVSRTINGASYAPALAETISKALDINTEYTISRVLKLHSTMNLPLIWMKKLKTSE